MKKPLKTNTLILILLTLLISWLLSTCTVVDLSPFDYTNRFKEIIETEKIPNLSTETDKFSKSILTNFEANNNADIVARYVTESGAGAKDGTSWENAWAGADLINHINAIRDASASKVYVMLVAGGTYKPTPGNDRTVSFSMKNYVGIVGGFQDVGGWEYTGTTVFSGDIGTQGDNTDNSYNVFFHDTLELKHAFLYKVTVSGGNADDPDANSSNSKGGGMYNNASSPRIVSSVFKDNTSGGDGGGMYNNSSSSPKIIRVKFRDNTSGGDGGAIYNNNSSSLQVVDTVFRSNTSGGDGGAIYNNNSSSLQVVDTIFGDNTSGGDGGAIYNNKSPSLVVGTVFRSNTSDENGGAIYNNNLSSLQVVGSVFNGNNAKKEGGAMFNNRPSSPINIINAVFLGNTATDYGLASGGAIYHIGDGEILAIYNSIFSENATPNTTSKFNEIAVLVSGNQSENIQLVGSILGIGKINAVSAVEKDNQNPTAINITYTSLANADPGTISTATMLGIDYTTISGGVGAKDLGLYVRKSGDLYYMSEDQSTWYTGVTSDGKFDESTKTTSLPADAEDLTATDIDGKTRGGRPDAGVKEE